MAKDERGESIVIKDPLAPDLARIATAHAGDLRRYVDAMLALDAVFGADLRYHQGFRSTVLGWLDQLCRDGVKATVARV